MTPRQHTRHAFTLIELLIVVAIIATLAAITTLVGSAVLNSGKKSATIGILQSLDQALTAYIDDKGANPPSLVMIPAERVPNSISDDAVYYPAIDGRGRENTSDELFEVNSVALFIESVRSVPQTQEVVNTISTRYIQNFSPSEDFFPQLLTVFDAWGNPIRYVHPKFDGIVENERRTLGDAGAPVNVVNPNKPFYSQGALPLNATTVVRMKFVRRNRLVDEDFGDEGLSGGGLSLGGLSDFELLPDSDGGITTGNRPYFYSAGPDGNPATLEDNIYLTPVQHADPGIN
jgi:prepilin-type N-terminal cleavage/methylation domain-containing protein